MAQFKSWDSYGHFSREIARRRRYVRTPDAEEFLRAVASTSKTRLRKVREGHIFYRAQLGHEWQTVEDQDHQYEQEVAFSPPRMKPRKERPVQGEERDCGLSMRGGGRLEPPARKAWSRQWSLIGASHGRGRPGREGGGVVHG
jgi:hypothetical protein